MERPARTALTVYGTTSHIDTYGLPASCKKKQQLAQYPQFGNQGRDEESEDDAVGGRQEEEKREREIRQELILHRF